MKRIDISANELEALVLKAARGGGCPAGLAEDLSAAMAFVDLEDLTCCPCDTGAVSRVPAALDAVQAHGAAQVVRADDALVRGYVQAAAQTDGALFQCEAVADGVMIRHADPATDGQSAQSPQSPMSPSAPLGRRKITPELLAHLQDMTAKTFVPETEASRAAGAGAGLTDND